MGQEQLELPKTTEEADRALRQLEALTPGARAFCSDYDEKLAELRRHREQLQHKAEEAKPLHGRIAEAAQALDARRKAKATAQATYDRTQADMQRAAGDLRAAEEAEAQAQLALHRVTLAAGGTGKTRQDQLDLFSQFFLSSMKNQKG